MKTIVHRIAIAAALTVLSTTVAFAAPPKCAACGMELSAKKTAKTSVAVKVGKKTMYCCAGCKMEKPAKKK
jgi:hypothetical protein